MKWAIRNGAHGAYLGIDHCDQEWMWIDQFAWREVFVDKKDAMAWMRVLRRAGDTPVLLRLKGD